MKPNDFFTKPRSASQRQYEALRAFYQEGLRATEAAKKFNFSPAYFKNLRLRFVQALRSNQDPYFPIKKTGPKKRFTGKKVIEEIIILRKQNHSIQDIQSILEAKQQRLSLDTIDKILKAEGFAPLPKRTRQQRLAVTIPDKIASPQCVPLDVCDEKFSTEQNAGPLIFLPLIEQLGLVECLTKAGYPHTSVLSDVAHLLSFIALKIIGNERLSHDTVWGLDRALGLFAGLNVLPKQGTLSSYSYRVSRMSNRKLLTELCRLFDDGQDEQEFNLDFKAIPHWGDDSVLEKNWSGIQSRRMKSILALIVQSPDTGFLSYTDAEIRQRDQNNAVIEFVDFWKGGRGTAPKMLIFDSKFTTYSNLDKLNESPEKINFLTLRRRGQKLIKDSLLIPEDQWQRIRIEGKGRKRQLIRVHDGITKLRNYQGVIRQIIITDHGRLKPTFLISNDFDLDVKQLVKKYSRRWLVEKEIAEQIAFFHLNSPSSSIVVKVDFDLTLSLLTHNLYRKIATHLPGFEHCTAKTIYRKFLENGATVEVKDKDITVSLKKKNHLPILFEVPWMKEKTSLSWLGMNIRFKSDTTS